MINEIGSLAGVTWNKQEADRDDWKRFGEVFVLQGLIMMMLMDELLQCRNILRINERIAAKC